MQEEKNPYDFIMNAGAAPKRRWLRLPSPGSKKQRLIYVAVGGAILILLFVIIFSLIFSSGDTSKITLKMAQQHTELLRISEIGVKEARGDTAKNLATTVKLTLQSSQDQIIAIAKKDQKISGRELSAGKDKDTDDLLTQASQSNNFDEVFTETIYEEVEEYLKQLQEVYDSLKSKSDRRVLNDVHTQLNKLLPAQRTDLN